MAGIFHQKKTLPSKISSSGGEVFNPSMMTMLKMLRKESEIKEEERETGLERENERSTKWEERFHV